VGEDPWTVADPDAPVVEAPTGRKERRKEREKPPVVEQGPPTGPADDENPWD